MHRLSLAALLVLSLSVSSSWAAPTLSGESVDMITGKSNIYYEGEYYRGQQQLNYDKNDIHKNNRVQRQGCLTSDNCGVAPSLNKRQQSVSGQPETLQGYSPTAPQHDSTGQQSTAASEPLQHPQNGVASTSQPEDVQEGQRAVVPEQQQQPSPPVPQPPQGNSGEPSSQPQQPEVQSQPQPQSIPQRVQNNGGDDDDDDGDDDDNENKKQVVALPASSPKPAQPVVVHQPVDLTPISNDDEVPTEGNGLSPTPTPLPPTPTSEPPINAIPSPATTTTTENNTPTPTKSNKMSSPAAESAGDNDGVQENDEESQPSSSPEARKKLERPDSTGHEYQDGLTVTIEDADNFCLMLPKSPGDQNIGESEKNARAFCTKEGLTPGAKLMPEGFIKDPVFKPGRIDSPESAYVQVTGTIDIAAYQLSAQDGGGQYDDHGAGSPPGSHCKNYRYYVSLIEPDQNRFCIRCCNSYKNCNAGRSEYGCGAVLRDE